MEEKELVVQTRLLIKFLAPHVKRFFAMIKTNIFYIIWLFVYFHLSTSILAPIFKWNTYLYTILIYVGFLFIANFAGEIILKLLEGARPIETKREKEYLIPIFEEVYQDVKSQFPSLPKIRLHIIDSLTVYGCAIGKHTVAVTQGAVSTFNAEELKGIIAHEISHIYYGDTKAEIFNTIGNGIFTILTIVCKLILRGLEYVAMMWENTVIQAVINLIRAVFELWVFCVLWLGKFILSFNSRGNEFKADKFAHETGYGEQLIESLYIIQKMSLGQKLTLVMKAVSSHPRVSKRIGRLEVLEDRYIAS